MDAQRIWGGRAKLGEGPFWDAREAALWFVDIKGMAIHRIGPDGGRARSWPTPAQTGWVLPSDDGRMLAGLQTGLASFDPESGLFEHLCAVEPHLPGNRLNDATVSRDGQVWFGTMDDGEANRSGRVYRWDGQKVTDIRLPPVVITNGPGISPDGDVLYHVDTAGRTIHACEIGPDGTLGRIRDFARIDPADGYPDGVTVDSAGNVWVGLWGGWRARLYSPGGSIMAEVRLPAANVTKVALGGADLRTAFVTTASVGLPEDDASAAGAVFAFTVEVPGQSLPLARGRCEGKAGQGPGL